MEKRRHKEEECVSRMKIRTRETTLMLMSMWSRKLQLRNKLMNLRPMVVHTDSLLFQILHIQLVLSINIECLPRLIICVLRLAW